MLRRAFIELRDLLRLYQGAELPGGDRCPEDLARIRERADRIDLSYVLENLEGLLDRTREGLRWIRGIVEDLRDFARLDSGGLAEVDPNHSLRSTLNIFAGRVEGQGVELDLDLAPLGPITCDPGKINQVVLNLLTNALDACPDGGKVTLRSRPAADGVEIHVIDTGHGIDPAARDKIFDPFIHHQAHRQGDRPGPEHQLRDRPRARRRDRRRFHPRPGDPRHRRPPLLAPRPVRAGQSDDPPAALPAGLTRRSPAGRQKQNFPRMSQMSKPLAGSR